MKILLMHQTITKYDAIGNDLAFMNRLFQKEYECFVYCEFLKTEGFLNLSRQEAEEFLAVPDNLVIYHHSGFWAEGEELLEIAKCRLMIRYHNVTPPEFFEGYSPFYYEQCKKGRKQTHTLLEGHPEAFWLCDSHYNRTDILDVSDERTAIIHPFHNLGMWESVKADEKVLEQLQAEKGVKVLFTGRVVPNKGHLDLIAMADNYRENYGEALHLYIVGKFDDSVKPYTKEVMYQVKARDLASYVHFIGEVTDETLMAYYQGCDYYVSFSNHEGFGVPFIEAQKLRLPLIVKDKGAAGEVLGENQLTFGDDVNLYSAAIAYLEEHPQVKEELIQAGYENCVSRFNNEKAGEKLLELIRKGW